MTNPHSAGASALGYFYQVRSALVLFLRGDRTRDVLIEALDDVQFDEAGTPVELVQTKHKSSPGSLSDASKDLWGSMRSWLFQINSGKATISGSKLVLISTATASSGSASSYLRPETKDRKVDEALKILRQTAQSSTNVDNKEAYTDFQALAPDAQEAFVSSIYVHDAFPDIDKLSDLLERELSLSVRESFLADFSERIEGWWFSRVVKHLRSGSVDPILSREILAEILDKAEEYHQDALPLHFADAEVPADAEQDSIDKLFIKQLQLLTLGQPRLKKAVGDYYRAFQQRSRWLRDGHVLTGDLEKYEKQLIDEWERIFESHREELPTDASDEDKAKAGRGVYNKVDQQLQIRIRPRVMDPFVMRGSFHILSDSGRVGWHPEFEERLKAALLKARGGAS